MLVPKTKKNLLGFLTKNSKHIVIVGVLSGTSMIAGINEANSGRSYDTNINPFADFYPSDQDALNYYPNPAIRELTIINSSTCGHISGVVNGHLSAIPAVSTLAQKYTISKQATYTHDNHSSGGWCF